MFSRFFSEFDVGVERLVAAALLRGLGGGGLLGGLAAGRTLGVLLGRWVADSVVCWQGLAVTAGIGVLVGFRLHGSLAGGAAAFGLCMLFGAAFAWLFIVIGLVAGSAQAATGMSLLVFPFTFVSSAYVPVQTMPGWMQPFAANQPVTVIINAVRSSMQGGTKAIGIGHTTTYWIGLSLLWCAGILLVFGFLATRRFSKSK